MPEYPIAQLPEVSRATNADSVEILISAEEAEKRGMEDLDFFANICMPDIFSSEYPAFYKAVWHHWITAIITLDYNAILRFALGLPRGHAKTTFLKLFVAYCVLYALVDFIHLVCSTDDKAKNFLSDVHDILSSTNIEDIYGSWEDALSSNTVDKKSGYYRGQHIIITCSGAVPSMRGLNIKNRRPQLIIFDDAQTKENAYSPVESKALMRWIIGTAIKSRDNKKCMVLYVGNLYSRDASCILWAFHQSPYWTSLLTGALLADGTALWPAIRTIDALIEEFNHDASMGEGASWFAEVQNDPIASTISILPDGCLPDIPEDLPNLEHTILRFITIDPAGRHKKSDDNVIIPHLLFDTEHAVVPEFTAGVMNPEQVIFKTIKYIIQYKIPIVFIEAVAYQETLAFWMAKYLEQYNLLNFVTIIPVVPGRASKLSRIRAWIKVMLLGGWHILDPMCRNRVLFQALALKLDRTDNRDDILDCLAQGHMVLNKHLDLIYGNMHTMDISATEDDLPDGVYEGPNSPIALHHRRT